MSQLPKGWVSNSLLDIVNLHDSQRIPLNQNQRAERQGKYPYYGANGQVDLIDDFIFDGHYILLAEDGGYFDDPSKGVAYEVSGRFWVNNHAHILSPCGEIPIRFLCYILNSLDWMPYVGGSTRLKLTQESMRRVLIPLPPLNEQRRIVAKLNSLFTHSRRAREELERIPKLIERYKQAVLAAAFRGDLTADWRESNSKGEPWKRISLGSVIHNIRYGTSKKCDYLPALTPVLRIPNIGDGYIVHNDIKYAEFDSKETEGLQLQLGDILIIRSNGSLDLVGKAAIVSDKEEGFLYAGYLIRLRPNCEIILPECLYYHLIEPGIRAKIELLAKSTSGVNNINSQELQSLNLHIPGIQEQKEIIQKVKKLFKAIDLIGQEYQKASGLCDRLEQATLSKTFRGELVPQNPDDEQASLLLERILAEKAGQPTGKRGRTKKRAG
ncbi:restriction endonuclease subunit S [Nostoc sp. 'Peltigera membranacea cyanobiont' 232]|uniref:restriction endonuclease subunit S n=1 Tax=Nostoc sp. 'Peltigera membranacea cyanobiont' 232 TaxID=2014531 RepID=UPI000B957B52|nr:restriction endonuclease subunit S [Nostoc sp. 'Peltigera membranacea cyanobiont' 232]OYE02734.1 hypothetical protein CDG79_22390 [Nostoc sp. 'Peltigera membranacea cyanobiont' 232]